MSRRISLIPSHHNMTRSRTAFPHGSVLHLHLPVMQQAVRAPPFPLFCSFHSKKPADISQSRQVFNDAEHSLKLAKKELETAKFDLEALFDVTGFGPEGEWKKLDGLCLEKDTGEYVVVYVFFSVTGAQRLHSYTYEVCLFGEAKQKPNKGGQNFSLGCVFSLFLDLTPHPRRLHSSRFASLTYDLSSTLANSPPGIPPPPKARPNTTANKTTRTARNVGTALTEARISA